MTHTHTAQANPTAYEKIEQWWAQLGYVPVDDDGCLEEPFLDFAAGTNREDVWRWFEEQHPDVSVAVLMGVAA